MRYHLYETNEERVPLAGEVEIMRNYIALMQLRLSDNVSVETSFEMEDPQTLIAPLLFIPLIENSFKHGVNPSENSRIVIRLEEKNHLVTFETHNTNFPQHYENDANRESNGIGLENLQKRLSLIYPGKHVFVKDFVDNLFHVKVAIWL
jgi:LytS/YehU family sensor histidine kinase